MFIELTAMDGTIEFVNANHIKRICESSMQGARSVIEWKHAPAWNNNPTDYNSYYKETPKEVFNQIYYARHEEGR
jgi:hypothetical protein